MPSGGSGLPRHCRAQAVPGSSEARPIKVLSRPAHRLPYSCPISVANVSFRIRVPTADLAMEKSENGQESSFRDMIVDCFNDQSADSRVGDVPWVPCSEPHDNEIDALFDTTLRSIRLFRP